MAIEAYEEFTVPDRYISRHKEIPREDCAVVQGSENTAWSRSPLTGQIFLQRQEDTTEKIKQNPEERLEKKAGFILQVGHKFAMAGGKGKIRQFFR